jgi:pimeloyl-ACP methyl ester carboxylesterase
VKALLGGRLPPEEMFPAGRAGYDVRWLTLPSGLRVRTVRCDPEGASAEGGTPAPVVVFVHGWACSLFTWHRNLRLVADAGVRAYAFDLVGHGLSDKPLDARHYTVPAMAQQLRDVLDGLGLDRVLLAAHSMGCAIALRAAIDTPERVAGLVLAAPVGFGAISDMRYLRWLTPRPVEAVAPYCVPRWTFRVALWRAYGRIGHASPRDIDEYWAPTRDPAFVRVLCRLAHTFDWTDGDPDELARIRCPTTVLFGERDHLVRSDACRPFMEHLPGVRWDVVPEAGHTLPEEVPDRVNAAVVAAVRTGSAFDAVPSSVAMG